MSQIDAEFVRILKKNFESLRAKNPRFSLRAFAKKAGVSIGTLSEVMSRKLKLSAARMEKIVGDLNLPERERARFLMMLGKRTEFPKEKLSAEGQEILVDWVYRSVLFSFDLDGHKPTLADLSRRLGISETEAQVRVRRLLDTRFLQENAGVVSRVQKYWTTSDREGDDFVRRMHLSNLELGRKILEEGSPAERDFTSLIFTGSRTQTDRLREEIRAFYDRALLIMEEEPRDELFQLAISFYPINFMKGSRE